MQENLSRIWETPVHSSISHTQLQDEMARMLRVAAEPVGVGELVEIQIRRAARRCGLAAGRAKKYWYREVSRVLAADYLMACRATRGLDALDAYMSAKTDLLNERLNDAAGR